jgi:hypothetical protein
VIAGPVSMRDRATRGHSPSRRVQSTAPDRRAARKFKPLVLGQNQSIADMDRRARSSVAANERQRRPTPSPAGFDPGIFASVVPALHSLDQPWAVSIVMRCLAMGGDDIRYAGRQRTSPPGPQAPPRSQSLRRGCPGLQRLSRGGIPIGALRTMAAQAASSRSLSQPPSAFGGYAVSYIRRSVGSLMN